MSVSGVGAGSAIQVQSLLCGGLGGIAGAVHDFVMKILHAIRDCFCGSPATAPTARTLTIGGPLNLVAFYRGQEPNNNGVTLDQILSWDDRRLEMEHNYIQWLFPLREPSGSNPTAPVLDYPTIQTFLGPNLFLRSQVMRSFQRMLSFFGLQIDQTNAVVRAPNFNARAAEWLTPGNHNFLRITRIIKSMAQFNLLHQSRSFFNIMQDIRLREGRGIISDGTFNHWRAVCPR